MSKLYDDIEEVIENEITVELLGDGIYGKRKASKLIKDIAIKAQIELLEDLRILMNTEDTKLELFVSYPDEILYDRIQELQKQLEA